MQDFDVLTGTGCNTRFGRSAVKTCIRLSKFEKCLCLRHEGSDNSGTNVLLNVKNTLRTDRANRLITVEMDHSDRLM
jgi:hypothetical protein